MLIDDYEADFAKLRDRYGERCKLVLLYEVGTFYEMYAATDDRVGDPTALYAVAELLNIAVTRKSKAILTVSRTNPLLAGIPVAAFAKYRPVLMGADYTVAIAHQFQDAEGKLGRAVDEVLSPGTWDGDAAGTSDATGRGALLAVVWVETRAVGSGWTGVGVAGVDLTTGGGMAAETHASGPDAARALDEARAWLAAARPRELVVLVEGYREGVDEVSVARRLACAGLVHTTWRPPAEMAKLAYQEAVLDRAFPASTRGLLRAVEHLGLERAPLATAAYATALEFAYQHDERVLARLRAPEPWPDDAMHVSSLEALNVTGSAGALLPLLNTCRTAFGRRLFAARLLRPTRDRAELERRWDAVAAMLEGGRAARVRVALAGVADLERLARRLALGRAGPAEVAALADSARRAAEAIEPAPSPEAEALSGAFAGWDLEALRRGDLGASALDASDATAVGLAAERHAAAAEVAALAGALEAKDDGDGLTTTRKRFDAALAADRVPGLRGVDAPAGRVRLLHPALDRRQAASASLALANRAALDALVARLTDDALAGAVRALVRAVGELDVAAAAADAAARHRYVRPTLGEAGERATVKARGLRHPLVERLLTEEPYAPNDVTLGPDGRGMLVYGLNAAGKSTLMKSVGIAVLMAQAGLFVAADSLELRPFDALYTRIGGTDNLFSGQSTFVLEMLEIRSILRRATADSLVLGDELCCGTESISATAIVVQGVCTLVERGCCFMLATHLHEIIGTTAFLALPAGAVAVVHLHVSTEDDGTLVYHRDLRNGHGETLYGLEVAKALNLGDAFIVGADAVRRELLGVARHLVTPRPSHYNADVFINRCFMCGEHADEVHHVRKQALADASGFLTSAEGVGAHHKNARFNLVAVCESCHDKQHANDGVSMTAVKTSRGKRIIQKRV